MLQEVCRLLRLDAATVLKSNREECVDARCALVFVLGRLVTDRQLSEMMNVSRQCVNHLRRNQENRYKWSWQYRALCSELAKIVQRYEEEKCKGDCF